MMASPVITFVWLQRETIPAVRSGRKVLCRGLGRRRDTPSSQQFPAPRPLHP